MLLECTNVTKTFGGIVALHELSLSVDEGEITGLIGPNGAGKTTCFNVITGVYPPDEGSVSFRGTDITGEKTHRICREGIARTFQTPKPLRTLSVEKNLLVAEHFGRDESETDGALSVDETLTMFNLDGKREVDPDDLQLMEQKFLDLARALMTAPRLILLDEIMAGLNPAEKERMGEKIREIHREHGTDFLVIEHDLHVIRTLSDRVLVINNGSTLATGLPEEVLEQDAVREAYVGG